MRKPYSQNRSRKPRLDPMESQIQLACTQLMELDGWRSLRTDPVSDRETGKGFGEPGMPDYLYIRYGQCPEVMWIEWKRLRGVPEPHQTAWHYAERQRGAAVFVAGLDFPASIEGFWAWYGAFLRNQAIKPNL